MHLGLHFVITLEVNKVFTPYIIWQAKGHIMWPLIISLEKIFPTPNFISFFSIYLLDICNSLGIPTPKNENLTWKLKMPPLDPHALSCTYSKFWPFVQPNPILEASKTISPHALHSSESCDRIILDMHFSFSFSCW